MKIAVIGGGPGGLYFSILTKKAMPHVQIDVYERNKPDDSFGFGVHKKFNEFIFSCQSAMGLVAPEQARPLAARP